MISGKFVGNRGEMAQARDDHSVEIKPELLVQEVLTRILRILSKYTTKQG